MDPSSVNTIINEFLKTSLEYPFSIHFRRCLASKHHEEKDQVSLRLVKKRFEMFCDFRFSQNEFDMLKHMLERWILKTEMFLKRSAEICAIISRLLHNFTREDKLGD